MVIEANITASVNTPRSDTVLTEAEIRRALHADRAVPLGAPNPHGPLGLEQLAAAVAIHEVKRAAYRMPCRVRRPIESE